jgi:hypothetical protein
MPRHGKPMPITFCAEQPYLGKGERPALLSNAEARFRAEREDLVRTVADSTIKERVAAQLRYRHRRERECLVAWLDDVDRRMMLLKLARASKLKG